MWTLEKSGKVFQMEQKLNEEIMVYDRMMKRGMKFTRMIMESICLMNCKRQKQQLPITMFFHKVEK